MCVCELAGFPHRITLTGPGKRRAGKKNLINTQRHAVCYSLCTLADPWSVKLIHRSV